MLPDTPSSARSLPGAHQGVVYNAEMGSCNCGTPTSFEQVVLGNDWIVTENVISSTAGSESLRIMR